MQGLCTSGHPAVLGSQRRAHLATFRSKTDKLTHRCSYAAKLAIEIKRKPQRSYVRCGAAGSNRPSLDQSPNLQEGIQEQKSETKWATATVTQNRNVSADGCMRSLTLSIEDPVHFLEGRKMPRRQTGTRWIDSYKLPGQMIGIRYCAEGKEEPTQTAKRLFAIASSPYDSRRDSSMLDASMIEVLVDKNGCADEATLAELGPGSLLSVSQVAGRGYASLFNSYVGLLSAAEDSRPLLLIGMGARGMGPLRAALEWTPVQAHATANPVTLFYITQCQQSAAYLADWDQWREAGVNVQPVYVPGLQGEATASGTGDAASNNNIIQDELEQAIFGSEQGLMGSLGGDPRDCAVLMSGLPGSVTATLTRRLTLEGITRERILFCDFI
ncbi:hypothetical protein ABBQ38_005642 [Trebouxia sp. C0009 RCD-2024]